MTLKNTNTTPSVFFPDFARCDISITILPYIDRMKPFRKMPNYQKRILPFITHIKSRYKEILWLAFALITVPLQFRKINGQDVLDILRPLWLLLLVVFVGFGAFVLVPQGQHAMKVLHNVKGNWVQPLIIGISLLYWSFQLYNASRMVLKVTNIRYDEGKEVRLYMYLNNIPIVLGTLPFCIILIGYWAANGLHTKTDWLLTFVFLFLNVVMVSFHLKDTCNENYCELPTNWRSPHFRRLIKEELSDKKFSHSMRWWFRFLMLTFIVLFVIFTYLSIFGIETLQFIGPIAIVITGLAAWVAVAAVVAVVNIYIYRFASLFILGLFIFSSYFNNNHAITTLNEPLAERLDVATHFKNWQQARLKTGLKSKKYPVFIVASEGGGSRSAYWTGSLLAALCDTFPEFSQHIFAISSVSGSSLGSGVFSLVRRSEVMENHEMQKLPYTQNALKKDFLSPLTASMIFPDLFQRFVPFKINAFDRAKALERSWENAFERAMGSTHAENPLRISLAHFWLEDSLYRMPSLFMNCTVVNTGKRAIISNLKLSSDDFDDVIALNDTIGKAIPLSTAMSLSARFPYITPSGVIQKQDGTYWGSVVDGGYFDNSGILTALEIMNVINKTNQKTKQKIEFEPHLIIISNYEDFHDTNMYNELNEPLVAVINRTFGGAIGYARARVKREMKPQNIIEFPLNANATDVPLGWYLSESSVSVMDYRVKVVMTKNYEYFKQLFKK